jgi:hypothetical protein
MEGTFVRKVMTALGSGLLPIRPGDVLRTINFGNMLLIVAAHEQSTNPRTGKVGQHCTGILTGQTQAYDDFWLDWSYLDVVWTIDRL